MSAREYLAISGHLDTPHEFFAGRVYPVYGASTVTNPSLIVEVLSKSTEDFDHGRKFVAYQQIPSFREYLLVSQNEPMVRAFRRNDLDQWTITTVRGLSASLRVETLDCEIRLADLYADVTFPPPDDAA